MKPSCPKCGKPQEKWSENLGKGFKASSGEVYCCQNCAEGKACTCKQAKAA